MYFVMKLKRIFAGSLQTEALSTIWDWGAIGKPRASHAGKPYVPINIHIF